MQMLRSLFRYKFSLSFGIDKEKSVELLEDVSMIIASLDSVIT